MVPLYKWKLILIGQGKWLEAKKTLNAFCLSSWEEMHQAAKKNNNNNKIKNK